MNEKNPNNRVQRTRHKVSGPLTRDVGSTEMKSAATILCVMIATALAPIASSAADTTALPLPPSIERIWTIGGHKISDLLYRGTFEKDGIRYARFIKEGLGISTIPLDELSPEDIEAIKEYDRLLESKNSENE